MGVVVVAWAVEVDGTDITSICQSIRWHPRLSRPASCIVRFPGHLFTCSTGISELHLSNGSLLFSGPVWFQQNDGEEDATYTELTAYDHLVYFSKRLCKTPLSYGDYDPQDPLNFPGACNLADPSKVILDYQTGPEILRQFIIATSECPFDAEFGAFPISVSSFATGGADLTGVPADWPMDIATMADLLISTGQLDIIVNPGFGSSSVDLYNGDAGTNRTGSVSIQYGTGAFNARGTNRTTDMDEMVNALWYLLGPRVHWYAGDISHWKGSITPTAANQGYDGPGGDYPTEFWPPALEARWMSSRATYGYMQEIQIHDSKEDEQTTVRPLFEEMYANEAYLRAVPRTIIHPHADRTAAAPTFFVGDLITMQAGTMLGGGYSGAFRVFEYELSIDADGVGEYTEIVGSADGD